MKTVFTYASFIALGGSLLTLALFFLGYHSDVDKVLAAQTPVLVISILMTIALIALGIRARRDETPAEQPFGYGRALGTGILIGLIGGVLAGVFNIAYTAAINPDVSELMIEAQVKAALAKGAPANEIEGMKQGMRMFSKPPLQLAFSVVGSLLVSTVISLIAAAFLRRREDTRGVVPTL